MNEKERNHEIAEVVETLLKSVIDSERFKWIDKEKLKANFPTEENLESFAEGKEEISLWLKEPKEGSDWKVTLTLSKLAAVVENAALFMTLGLLERMDKGRGSEMLLWYAIFGDVIYD